MKKSPLQFPKNISPEEWPQYLRDNRTFFETRELVIIYQQYELSDHDFRNWEAKFPMLKPERRGRDRIYSRDDLELLDDIVYLIKEEKLKHDAAAKRIFHRRKRKQRLNRAINELEKVKDYLIKLREFANED